MIETFVAVQPSQNFEVDAAAAPIDVPDSREVDELRSRRELVRQAREAGVALTGGRVAQSDDQDGHRDRSG